MSEKYLVFAGNFNTVSSPRYDFRGSLESLESAIEHAKQLNFDWIEILDTNGVLVWEYKDDSKV